MEAEDKAYAEKKKKKADMEAKAVAKSKAPKSGGGGHQSSREGKMLIYLGLPLVAGALYFMTTQKPSDIHSIEWYEKHPDYWKKRAYQIEQGKIPNDEQLYPDEQPKPHVSF